MGRRTCITCDHYPECHGDEPDRGPKTQHTDGCPGAWTNERCPAHGRFRCAECLGVPETPGPRGGRGSLATVVATNAAMRVARAKCPRCREESLAPWGAP